MTKYDNTGDVKRRRFPVSLIILIVGVVLLIVGLVLMKVTGTESLGERYSVEEQFDAGDITDIYIKCPYGEIDIEKSDDGLVHVSGEKLPVKLTARVDDGMLKVYNNKKWSLVNFGVHFGNFGAKDSAKLTVSLPEKQYESFDFESGAGEVNINDISFKKGSLDFGAGEINASDIRCEKIEVDFGAGEADFNGLVSTDKADFDMGAGEVTFENCSLNKSDFDCGVGQLNYSGELKDDADIDGGVGEINFTVDGYCNDYKLITDGHSETNYNSNETTRENKIRIDVDNGLGDVIFNFI